MNAMTNRTLKLLLIAMLGGLFSGCATKKEVMVEAESEQIVASEFCAPDQGPPFSYRKRIAVLAADVKDPQADLAGLEKAWSEVLQERLNESGRLLVVDASHEHIHHGELQAAWVKEVAKRLNVQFIIAPRFHNLHPKQSKIGSGYYTVSLPSIERQINADVVVYDGYTGKKMDAFSQYAVAGGWNRSVMNHQGQPVMKGGFLNTELGKAMDQVLAAQTDATLEKLACLPLTERVFKVSGRNFYISAKGASMIRPGDTLHLFRKHGLAENRLGALQITRVFPESVVGVYRGEGDAPQFAHGLVVRAW